MENSNDRCVAPTHVLCNIHYDTLHRLYVTHAKLVHYESLRNCALYTKDCEDMVQSFEWLDCCA